MYDVIIVGGGIVGLSTTYQLLNKNPNLKVIILEKDSYIAGHQTGYNSGVIHSGIYYKPGSSKARNCKKGIRYLIDFCERNDVQFEICGKIIIATDENEKNILNDIFNRGIENNIKGIKMLSSEQIVDYEPYATGLAAIHCPTTGIIDYKEVCYKLSENIRSKGEISLDSQVVHIDSKSDEIVVSTTKNEFKTKYLINCSGLYSDKIAELAGFKRDMRIVPFRGEYYMLNEGSCHLVKNLIYPVTNPRYPFLGVHFTRTINGNIEAGPNAVLAWAREGYKKTDLNIIEMWDYLSYGGFWKMAFKYWPVALKEYYRSFVKYAFVSELRKLIPDINPIDINESPAGVRAQALSKDGHLIDDFIIKSSKKMTHVINAPSPAATSSLAIGESIANSYLYNHD